MTTPAAQAAIAAAMTATRTDDVIAGIKDVVIRELETLDPGAAITVTDYFNHSFVPDMVVRWDGGGSRHERPVFLRFTLRAALLGQDVQALSSSGPIVLALRQDSGDDAARETVRESVELAPRLLLTDVSALDEAVTSSAPSSGPASPLLSLVQQSIVRGARGLLDTSTMQELNASASPVVASTGDGNVDRLGTFDRIVESVFSEEAAFQLRRSAEILRIGLSEDAEAVLAAGSADDADLLRGLLSSAELHALIPYLLSRPDVTTSRIFWAQVGSMMDLAALEDMSYRLEGLDLGPLVSPNLDTWRANRAYLTSVAEDDVAAGQDGEVDQPGWRIRAGLLNLAIADWRLTLASDGRRLRGRSDSLSARWSDLDPVLEDFELSRVMLRGAARSVEIGAAGDGDVRSDVDAITASIEDDFFVPEAHVRERRDVEPDFIRAEFSTMLAVAKASAPLRSLARTALRVLGYRYPPPADEFDRLLGQCPNDLEIVIE